MTIYSVLSVLLCPVLAFFAGYIVGGRLPDPDTLEGRKYYDSWDG